MALPAETATPVYNWAELYQLNEFYLAFLNPFRVTKRALFRASLLVAAVMMVSGCAQLSYYTQATRGQLDILLKRKDVDVVINHPDTPPQLAEQLKLAREIRAFASEQLALPDNDTFRQYSDLERRHVVWNVVAAPRFSLAPKTWCFPIAGCVSYKGYFAEAGARREQQALEDDAFDTFLYGVSAYSTLGWFDDPLLNTFIHYPEADLASLIFHELAHQVAYTKDDSEFNEAFATAVELEGLKRWLASRGNSEQYDRYASAVEKHTRITRLMFDYRDQLSAVYESDISESEKALKKQQIIDALKQEYRALSEAGQGTGLYDWYFSQPLNNAHLVSLATYQEKVPAFQRLLERMEGDLEKFYSKVQTLAKSSREQRAAELSAQ